MKRAVRHHYLPQFYLKNFANQKKNVYQIHAYDLKLAKGFAANIKDVALEIDLYTATLDEDCLREISLDLLKQGMANKLIVTCEDGLSEMESKFAPALNKLIEVVNPLALSVNDYTYIATFCANMILRNPSAKETIENILELTRKAVKGEKLTSKLKKQLNPSGNLVKMTWLQLMDDLVVKFTKILRTMVWQVGITDFGATIHTSDKPILLYNPFPRREKGYGGYGIGCRGIQIYFPLTPYMVLLFTHSGDYPINETVFSIDHEKASFIKSLMVKQANRFLYANQPELFDVQPGIRKNVPSHIMKNSKRYIQIKNNPEKYL